MAKSEEQTVPNPSIGGTVSAASRGGAASANNAGQAPQSGGSGDGAVRKRGRWRATRGLARSSDSCAVTMWRPAGSMVTVRSPSSSLRTNQTEMRSATTRLKLRNGWPSNSATAVAAARALICRVASRGSTPRLRLPGIGPRLPGRFSTAATTPARPTAIQGPPPERSLPPTASGYSGQWAAGACHGRSSRSSRLAASKSGQAWPGRCSVRTVHTVRDVGPHRCRYQRSPPRQSCSRRHSSHRRCRSHSWWRHSRARQSSTGP